MDDSEPLKQSIAAALSAKGALYRPRTRHLRNGYPLYTNRLIFEDSPYLLQHAHNPVDWFPWGEEAFAKARNEHKPVFLSIGYATCHWCHVMEEESFENLQIAGILNEYFIAIKVDREQYPDIDQTYMTAVTMIAGRGGWPMSSFLTGQGKPFYGGAYYQPAVFTNLLLNIKQSWDTKYQAILTQAEQLAAAVHQAISARQQTCKLKLTAVQSATQNILANYDSVYGGFTPAPKFPNEPLLLLLLQAAERKPDATLVAALDHTLCAMAQGGLYDQVGGGFHRYAVDESWLTPHFEKMLYNQAYMARVYTKALHVTGNPLYSRIVRQTLDYVLREMTTANGVFYSATDADSEGHEGTFFIWTEKEILQLLDRQDGQFICHLYGVTRHGNFEGKNILFLPESLDLAARRQGCDLQQLLNRIDPLLEKLRLYREKRVAPLTDNKIIVAWNAMFITALVEAGDLLGESRYINAARRAVDFLWQTQRIKDGCLMRVCLNGKSSIPARQDDYAHFIEALLALYDVTGDAARLQQAKSLGNEMLDKFVDPSSGALIMGREKLLFTQPKDAYDGALPSGNAVAVRVLSRLSRRCGKPLYARQAEKILQCFSGSIANQPAAYAYMLAQLDELNNGETGPLQYAAMGAIKIKVAFEAFNEQFALSVDMEISEGWSINAGTVDDSIRAIEIILEDKKNWRINRLCYPQPVVKNTTFNGQETDVYQGRVLIQAEVIANTKFPVYPLPITLLLQCCNRQSCMPRETVRFYLFCN